MNLKRIFGAVLTVLGIGGLIYGAIMFVESGYGIKETAVVGGLGLIFFFSGLGLIRTTKDAA